MNKKFNPAGVIGADHNAPAFMVARYAKSLKTWRVTVHNDARLFRVSAVTQADAIAEFAEAHPYLSIATVEIE